jgi:ribosomal-protein-serine acetyltransferase
MVINGKRILKVDDKIVLKEIGFADVEAIYNTVDHERIYLGEWLPFVEFTREISYTHHYIGSAEKV